MFSHFNLAVFLTGCFIGVIAGEAIAQQTTYPNGHGPFYSPGIECCDSDSNAGIRIERGTERPFVDGVGWIVGIPRKVFLWDRRADNHDISESTVDEVAFYMQHRGLTETVVRVNQYAPADEWRRLVENRRVGAGWRYSLGTLRWFGYTILPGRIFGNDDYNPYSNSLYLYSDMPALGLASAAYAQDVKERDRPGTYAAVQSLPIVALWHETIATDEVIQYVSIHGSTEQIEDVRHDLYARYGLATAGELGLILPGGGVLYQAVGAVGGHTVAAVENGTKVR